MATPSCNSSEQIILKELQELRTQLGKKQSFETAVTSIKSLILSNYLSSTTTTQKLFYDVVCRVDTVLRTRYTAIAFLLAGVDLLTTFEQITNILPEKTHLKSCISAIRQNLPQDEDNNNNNRGGVGGGYLFEGHLTVDPEPPLPNWLALHNQLTTALSQNQNSNVGADSEENMVNLLSGIAESLEGLEDFLLLDAAPPARRTAPPASKAVVEKLPVVKVDEIVLERVGEEGECCICKEKFGMGDEMQELPCKHLFHPLCLKPWLDEHNSCPICRHELPTDDHKYESWKEREKELEEERRGAANAVRGGEFMYI